MCRCTSQRLRGGEMTGKEEVLLNAIKDIIIFVSLTFAMLYARDLMQAVQYGFMLVAMTIINKK